MANETLRLLVPEDCPEDGDLYDGYYECPSCETPFNDSEWGKNFAYGDRAGFGATYFCPTDGCNGQVMVSG